MAKYNHESHNSSSPSRYGIFINAADADKYKEFRQMTGGFELKKVEESTPTKLVALGLNVVPRPADFSLPHLSESEIDHRIAKETR